MPTIGVPDAGQGERVHAVVVLKPGRTAGALPVSPAGKVLKHRLREPHWEGMDRQVH